MNDFVKNILRKISFSSKIFWDIKLHYTPERIFEEKVAGILYFKNKLTREEIQVELDVESYQWYIDDKGLWEECYFDQIKNGEREIVEQK